MKNVKLLCKDINFTCWILPNLQYFNVPVNTLIYRIGDPADEIYFLLEGSVKIDYLIVGIIYRYKRQYLYDN